MSYYWSSLPWDGRLSCCRSRPVLTLVLVLLTGVRDLMEVVMWSAVCSEVYKKRPSHLSGVFDFRDIQTPLLQHYSLLNIQHSFQYTHYSTALTNKPSTPTTAIMHYSTYLAAAAAVLPFTSAVGTATVRNYCAKPLCVYQGSESTCFPSSLCQVPTLT